MRPERFLKTLDYSFFYAREVCSIYPMDALDDCHLSGSRYCFVFDSSHALLRVNVSKSCPIEEMYIIYGDPMDFARVHHEPKMEIRYENKSFYFYETALCLYPIRLMYIFRFVKDGKAGSHKKSIDASAPRE